MSGWLQPVAAGLVRPEHAREIISPAYDLLDPIQRRDHGRVHPRSFLNGTPSEGDDADLDHASRRAQAKSYLRAELDRGTWEFHGPSFYLLEIESAGHVQIGVVGDVAGDRFPDLISPHEATRPDRVADLADYFETVGFGSSPVGLAYRRSKEVDEVVARLRERSPALDVILDDGDRERVWAIDTDSELASALGSIPRAYIIDGHHRVAATIKRGLAASSPGGRFLSVAFPHDQLSVFPFHRWLGIAMTSPLARPAQLAPRPGHAVVVTREGEWLIDLETRPDEVDVAALARTALLELGVEDERTDARLSFVPGFPGPEALRQKVRDEGGIGFLLAPSSIEEVMDHSDRGEFMPPKATFFSPKPRSGVFLVRR
ncbi:MAG TPA: DUF1015 family protein [Acidimicrobiia bacterium]